MSFKLHRVGTIASMVFLAALLAAAPARAAGAAASAETERLIAELGRSGCQFQRNGSWHDAAKAEAHLRRKYEWMRERDLATDAEAFIEQAGSRSSLSGRAYQVRCPGRPVVPAAEWLREKLRQLRGAAPARH